MNQPTFNIGIEEEYQIVDPKTRELKSYITQMIEGGQIKAKKIGSQYRISKSALDDFLKS